MASLMTLSGAHIREIRAGRWMVITKAPEWKDQKPDWQMIGIDAKAADHLMLTGEAQQILKLRDIEFYDANARVFSVRETEPIKTVFSKSGSVKSLCEAVRKIYEEQLGLSLSQVLNENGWRAAHDVPD